MNPRYAPWCNKCGVSENRTCRARSGKFMSRKHPERRWAPCTVCKKRLPAALIGEPDIRLCSTMCYSFYLTPNTQETSN